MKKYIIIVAVAIVSFLLGTLFPSNPYIQEKIVTKVERDTIVHTLIKSVPIENTKTKTEYIYIPNTKTDTIFIKDTVWLSLQREYYFSETNDVKIWHSGIDSRIDSLVNFRETRTIQAQSFSRHTISLSGDIGFNMLGVGANYEYNIFKWLSVNAKAGYNFHMKQPYVSAGVEFNLYSW